ncbi:TAXI family TRAP transporter solute-binding subunit [Nocardiopsis changdeensis]|uniref:TAXI family TRAP transporter solute-binding subunit n=1 Tax=Nocardiopsis changdeensis TaxID=2831969 RepID=A0ABX8BQ70_9ACTN|nr:MULTISPECIES: TAXI family TRAP transporter solute-binding subunit [Nocardiopsis]QUX22538.1 TAXI family TRAP transporter solute-binding subunit [Nocardiopsis changdeensis]QYX38479.1 TAXI family TRAP transporter solute-binding subunit [Nocardiopsis sp. MT53]
MGPDRRSVLLGALGAAAGAVLAGCARESGVRVPELVIATGPPGAVFREIGAEIAVLMRERLPGTEVVTVDTNASHDNLYLLEDGNAHLGLSSLDSTLDHESEISEGGVLSAVGRLYDSFVHLVVPEESAIRGLDDLAGLRVSVGSKDSGTEFTAQRILRETGLSAETVLMDQAASAEALASGGIDAMFSLTGLPTPAIAGLARERDVRFIDLSGTAGVMADAYPESYFQATIPATTYHGVPACPTMSTPNLLLCRSDLPDDLVFEVTDTVYRGAARLAAQRPEAAQINVRTGISTGLVPLHPGAERWYRENKPS